MTTVAHRISVAVTLVSLVAVVGSFDGCMASSDGRDGSDGTGTGTGTVVSITDGDTLRLDIDGSELRVRLIGIDTPEVYPEVQCFGPEADSALAALAPPGSVIGYAYDQDPRDRYDRELLYLFTTDGTSINRELVAQGYARAVLFEPNDLYWDDLQAAERSAKERRLGLWGQC